MKIKGIFIAVFLLPLLNAFAAAPAWQVADAEYRLAVKTDHPGIVLDGKTAPFTLTGHADSWAFIAVEIPSGKHLLDIAIK